MGRIARAALALGLAAALGACGSQERSQATGAPMGGAAAAQDAAGGNLASNAPPVITRVVIEPQAPLPGQQLSARVEASDPDGDRLEIVYQWWVNGSKVDGGPSLHIDAVSKGSRIELRVVARDGEAESAPATAKARVANQPPVLLGVLLEPQGQITTQHDVTALPRANDPDGDELEYEFEWWVNGRRVDLDGPVLPTRHFRRGDRIELVVLASDGTAETEPLRSHPIEVLNASPRIASEPPSLDELGVFRYQAVAEDPDGDRQLRYRLLEAPSGMRVDPLDGLLTWEPRPTQSGRHPVVLEVEDGAGGKASQSFELRVEFTRPG
jgi:hypothetical protein